MYSPDSETTPLRVLLIDDHPLRRASLQRFLQDLPKDWGGGFDILSMAPTSPLPLDQPPASLLLLSIGGASAAASADAVQDTLRRAGDIPVVVLADQDPPEDVVAAFSIGVRGFITTRIEPRVMCGALRFIAGGGTVFPPAALLADRGEHPDRHGAVGAPRTGLDALTGRQRDVLRLLGHGYSNKRIAIDLRMCESTVKVHVRQIMRKLKASNRTQAALHALELTRETAEIASVPAPAELPDKPPARSLDRLAVAI
ncbi:LuxR C-terminal-related transcriptional regulator [Falsiroseomonas sp. CW058]|uniref:LuxR C-terminal-related transcriptional regulator n=1 Tax=Falsiroseomonas sp. CW058 TaxID=3388664 RepID=UPI003D3184EF